MATPNLKASERPVTFVLHNQATGASPVKLDLVIRPEDLTRTEQSRMSVIQTMGGAWADVWGPNVPMVNISGTTGWGAGNRPNGLEHFLKLHNTVFKRWHAERAEALQAGLNPDDVKLIFSDGLDEFTWVVAPQQFVLRRNKARPLLAQYQIALLYLDDGVFDKSLAESDLEALAPKKPEAVKAGLDSLNDSLKSIDKFFQDLDHGIDAALGPIAKAVRTITDVANKALKTVSGAVDAVLKGVTGAIGTVMSNLSKTLGPVISVASKLARVAGNVMHIVQGVVSLPSRIKAKLSRVAGAFNNAFCVIRNIFSPRKFLPNYDPLFGSSMCSSTAGGHPISKYNHENPFNDMFQGVSDVVSVSSAAASALNKLAGADTLEKKTPLDELRADISSIASGVKIAHDRVKALAAGNIGAALGVGGNKGKAA